MTKLASILIAGSLLLAGCVKPEFYASRIHYIKDARGICYATVNENASSFSFTSVPCDKVGL